MIAFANSGNLSIWEWVIQWATALGALATAAALIVIWLGFRSAVRDRHTVVLLDIARRWDEPEMLKARRLCFEIGIEAFPERWMEENEKKSKAFFETQRIPNYFEDVGTLVTKGIVDLETISDTIGNSVIYWWKYFGPAAELFDRAMDAERLQENRKKTYMNFRKLNDDLSELRSAQAD